MKLERAGVNAESDRSWNQFSRRGSYKKPHKPMRTIQEMADEFGITRNSLEAYIRHHNGPQSQFYTKSIVSKKQSWVDPQAMRKWWAELKK